MKRILFLIYATLLMLPLLSLPAYAQLAGIRIRGYTVESIRPASMHSLTGKVTVRIRNTGQARDLRNVSATLYRNGEKVATGRCSDLHFPRGDSDCTATGTIKLTGGVSVLEALRSVVARKASGYTLDIVCALIREDGSAETMVRRGIPVDNYLK